MLSLAEDFLRSGVEGSCLFLFSYSLCTCSGVVCVCASPRGVRSALVSRLITSCFIFTVPRPVCSVSVSSVAPCSLPVPCIPCYVLEIPEFGFLAPSQHGAFVMCVPSLPANKAVKAKLCPVFPSPALGS